MGSKTENIIDTLFNTTLNKIQQATETSNERGSGFTRDSVGILYYHFRRIDIRRGESYIMSPDWIANKKATINLKNEKYNACFKWSIIAGLNYNKIREKELKKLMKKIMINDEANNSYCFSVKILSELNSPGWLIGKKETIITGANDSEDALDDALDYQTIAKKTPEGISELKHYISKYNWKGIDFPAGPKDWVKFEKNNKTIALKVFYILRNTKAISVAYRSEYNNKRKKQVILLMISNGKKQHYLAVTNLSALLQRISSNHKEDFYCLNCFNSYTSKINLKNMKKYAIITIATA